MNERQYEVSSMTFEKVLEVFSDYLNVDTDVEIIKTKHGWTYMLWDDCRQDWSHSDYAATPETLRDMILDSFRDYLEMQITGCERDLTDDERGMIEERCEVPRKLCDE